MKGALLLLHFLLDAAERGEQTALVTLTDVVGRSSRAPGSLMAVREDGEYRGSFSGGCIEAAVVAEARRVMAAGNAERIRFGSGSPFIDIRLPCGGGVDLLITPNPDPLVLRAAVETLQDRRSTSLDASLHGSLAVAEASTRSSVWTDDVFSSIHHPDLALIIAGQGAETEALARQATAYGAAATLLVPLDGHAHGQTAGDGRLVLLKTPASHPGISVDPYSAIILLFHDHDWETDLLSWAVRSPAFFVGAMGSQLTHATRVGRLRSAGLSQRQIDRVVSPIGLIPSVRDPDSLGISILGHVVSEHLKLASHANTGRHQTD